MHRLKELDVLRGFAALNVMVYHYTSRFIEIFKIQNPPIFDWYVGHVGVELFFMISGFVIFMSLQNVKNIKEFIVKRLIRLYPAYWICIIITLVIATFYKIPRSDNFSHFQIVMNFTMIQGLFEIPNIDGVYWSLLPELFFYLLMAILYYIKVLKNIKTIAIIWLFWMILNKSGILPYGEYFLNLKYGMFFLAGIFFYNLRFKGSDKVAHFIVISCLLTGIYVNEATYNLIVYPILFAIFYLLINDRLKLFNWTPLLFLGSISYPLYLLHQNIGYALINYIYSYFPNYFIAIIFTIATMFLLAWLVKNYLENPVSLFLKHQFLTKAKTQEIHQIKREISTLN
jgi:peptidoglycan/LPS O-acetylase OafA/YrhL